MGPKKDNDISKVIDSMVSIDFVKNLCTKYCYKSLNKQSSGVQNGLIHFTLFPMGKIVSMYEQFG
jgi:hypothetical protein